MTEVNFNGRDGSLKNDYLSSNPACDIDGLCVDEDGYGDDNRVFCESNGERYPIIGDQYPIAVEDPANMWKPYFGAAWEWSKWDNFSDAISNASSYIAGSVETETETMEEVIKRVVHEAVSQLMKEGNLLTAPVIEKYHLKHK
jgi:hypothetical protein